MKRSNAASDKEYFLGRIRSDLESRPELVGRVETQECSKDDPMDVHVVIRTNQPSGFDVHIQFFDGWEINVVGDECIEDFLLVDKARFSEENRRKVDSAVDLALGLLGPRYRLRQHYRGGHFQKGLIEEWRDSRWTPRARTRRLLWLRGLFRQRTEKTVQNHLLPR